MPKVGGVEFPYTKKGMQKAKAWSEMIGKPIKATPMPKKKGQKPKAKPMPKKKGSVDKVTSMKYENGGYAEFNPGDATITQREATKQRMMSPKYMEQIANLIMGTVGGGPKLNIKKLSDMIKLKGKKQKFTPPEGHGFGVRKGATWKNEKAFEENLKKLAKMGFADGGQIPQETLLRSMFALGGEIPAGRRMYGMGKKKKSLQTADVGPVRGMKKGGKVKYHV